ncbi:TetR/AcrR family transcriptional regulator [Paraconexibacter sp.]|uniref:TetR/AcrR family transcriptional regulator n=1 Tax=Paraconexibacter sp. TaxID=2949640 RepID=UPI0035617C5F
MSSPASSTPGRPLRKDAERNRRRVLEAAREVFAARGLTASLDDIAHHAGVGVGTVYRRFPDKEQLIDALFEDRVAELQGVAEEGLALDDPWEGLVHFLIRSNELQAADRGLKDAVLGGAEGCTRVAHARSRISPLVARLLARAQAAGAVRADADITDLVLAQIAIGAVAEATSEVSPDTWRRFVTLILDGLRTGGTEFPAPPLDDAQLEQTLVAASAAALRRRR